VVQPAIAQAGSKAKGVYLFGIYALLRQDPQGRFQGKEPDVWEIRLSGSVKGMARTFGLKKGFLGYALARAVEEPLFEGFIESGVDAVVTESSVCSIHLREGTGMSVRHPLELLRTTG
jgi:hypothetical protein